MDGNQRMKQQERWMARSGHGSRATDRFEAPRGDPTGMSQAERSMSYDYGHTAFQDVSNVYGFRQAQAQAQGPNQSQSQSRRREQFVPYESAMLYGFGQQGPAPGPFEAVPQYPTRQSAAIEALSNTFSVPQYFAPEDAPAGVHGLSPYLNAGVPYNQPGPMPRSSISQPFPTMSDFSPIGHGRLNPPLGQDDGPRQDLPEHSVDEAFSQYQLALRGTFDHTRGGRLVDASRSLLEISEWLVTNARDLGILRDDHLQHDDRLQLWNHFNLCWLALCQKQKDMTQDLVSTGHQPIPTSLLSRERMEEMGKVLIQLCDQLEQHGLVDYQMGIWEEEILCVLGQCLDLMESRPDLVRAQTVPEPATTTQRP
ncbi:uncharacterized protein N7477_004714 [Penicillium maclennaniae]|uniref:uncharacterized protein n=1 Tax=Penicillium maclennaniae TaxID=1343394 RepID=UPI002541C7D2|nr:uncharacterized protein N7477_004714 [Penicillium maclennaniae]KAJ5674780.1 hypothetical protein N7477_004714 [Penicillium maclennaniae]